LPGGKGVKPMDDVTAVTAFRHGVPIEVVCRFTGSWVSGFEVADTGFDGCRVRRLSDGAVLPVLFGYDEVRVARRHWDAHPYARDGHAHDGGKDSPVVVRLPVTLDIATVEAIRALVMDAVDGARDEVVLDLGAVRFLDTYGIRLLITIRRRAWARDLRVRVEGANPLIQALLDLVAVDPAYHRELTTTHTAQTR
jgi:anti-anti-sigma factor